MKPIPRMMFEYSPEFQYMDHGFVQLCISRLFETPIWFFSIN